MANRRTSPPTDTPVSLAEIKSYLRVDGIEDDELLRGELRTSTEVLEDMTFRQFVTATYELTLDGFPWQSSIEVPVAPLASVTSITYYNTDNQLVTLDAANYYVDPYSEPGRIVLAKGQSWPHTYDRPNAVVITYTAGYANAAAVPELAKRAIKLMVAHAYEQREPVITGTIVNVMPFALESAISLLRWRGHVE